MRVLGQSRRINQEVDHPEKPLFLLKDEIRLVVAAGDRFGVAPISLHSDGVHLTEAIDRVRYPTPIHHVAIVPPEDVVCSHVKERVTIY